MVRVFTCGVAPETSFPHLRDGSYTAWSLLRVVTDDPSVNQTNFNNVNNLAQGAQLAVNGTVPDFVPFTTSDSSDGLPVYRAHYTQSGVTPNDEAATPQVCK